MPNEKDFEDALAKYPELIEEGLRLIGRQKVLYGRRIDLLFEDKLQRQLLVELKSGPIRDEHIGQLMHYEGALLSGDNPDLRIMLIGTRVPPNIRRSLDHHGIAWKEIRAAEVLAHVRDKQDPDLAAKFNNELDAERASPSAEGRRRTSALNSRQHGTSIGKSPALLALVEQRWIEQALEEFGSGKQRIFFGTKAGLARARSLPITTVYFKVTRQTCVSAKAELIEITDEHPPSEERLFSRTTTEWKFYYGFRNLTRLPKPVPLSSLRRYGSGLTVRNDVP